MHQHDSESSPSILVIDDNPEVLAVLVDILEALGYSPAFTSDPLDGLHQLAAGSFDVVISDLVMPQVSGLEVFEAARRHNPYAEVVFVTGWPVDEVIERGSTRGVFGLLQKPVGVADLDSAVRAAYGRGSRRQDLLRELAST